MSKFYQRAQREHAWKRAELKRLEDPKELRELALKLLKRTGGPLSIAVTNLEIEALCRSVLTKGKT